MKTLITLGMLLFVGHLAAQTYSLTGAVADPGRAPLAGAHVILLYPWDEPVATTISGTDGRFAFAAIEAGGYKVRVSFLGFADLTQEITLKETTDLGTLRLQPGAVDLGEVEVTETVVAAQQLGDTTQYNADAYKTLPDANAEQLLEKMPGVIVENGKVQAQGEDVKEVLVDGKPFFGNDPTAALRNLPAEVIQKIQVFDQQSDQAQFTGVNDGETTKTINIITRPNMRNGQFGKVTAGYGTDSRYQGGGNASIFNGDQRISVIGQLNNVNQQNFASEDLLGVTGGSARRSGRGRGRRGGGGGGSSAGDFLVDQQGGIATTQAIGINFSDEWGEKLEVNGSYFFNRTDNVSVERQIREYVDVEEANEVYAENNDANSENHNHRLSFRLEYEFDDNNSIIMRPRVSFQQNQGQSLTFGQTSVQDDLLNQSENNFSSNYNGVNFSNNLTFRHRFNKPRRTFSVNLSGGYNDKNGDSFLYSENQYFVQNRADTLDQFSQLMSQGWNGATSLSYTEPVGEQGMVQINYRASLRQDDADTRTRAFSETTQDYTELNEPLSSVYTNDYLTQAIGGGYTYSKGRDFTLMTRANLQWAKLTADETFPQVLESSRTFVNVLPMAMLRINMSRQENIRVFYRTSTDEPSLNQLQNVVDNSNPLQLSIGNPLLDQAYTHRLFARYRKTNTEKSTVFFALVSGSVTDNYIANSVYLSETDHPLFAAIDLAPGAQLTRPVNVDGYVNLRSFLTYGMPISFIKSNLNLDLNANYVRSPGLVDDQLNYSNNTILGVGLSLGSNISDKIDFHLATRSNFNKVNNTLRGELNDNFLNQTSRVRLDWILPLDFVFRTQLTHQLYDGLAGDFDQSYLLWNMGIGKKLFKNQLGEITLSVFDLLRQNQSIQRNVSEVFIEDTQTNVLQQYFMLSFTYNFRNFGTGTAPPQEDDFEERRRRMRERF